MKLWLLLASLLASDPRPLGDEGLVVGDYSWGLCGKLLLGEQMAPRGLEMLLTHVASSRSRIRVHCDYIAAQHKQWNVLFHQDNMASEDLSNLDPIGIIHCSHFPVMTAFLLHKDGKGFPESLASDSLPAICFISGDTSAAGGIGCIAATMREERADSQSVWFVHHHSDATGSRVQTFLLETSKGWATATAAPWKKMLTKRYCAAAFVIISCCFKASEKRSAGDVKKTSRRAEEAQMRQTEDAQQARSVKYLRREDGRHSSPVSVSRRDFVRASALYSGSSSVKTSDLSELEKQRSAAGTVETDERLNLNDGPTLRKSPREQLSLKPATRVDNDDVLGFYVNSQHLQYNLRPNREETITQAELQPPEREGETAKRGNQKKSARILQPDFTEEGEKGLVVLFFADAQIETQAEATSARTLALSPDVERTTVNARFKPLHFINADNLKCKCSLEGKIISEETYAVDMTVGRHIKPAESFTEATLASAHTEETRGNTETNNAAHESMNHTKQEEKRPQEASLIRPPLEREAEGTTIHTVIKESTSGVEVFTQISTQRDEETSTVSSGPGSEPRCITYTTRIPESRTGGVFTGLRMREDALAHLMKHYTSEANTEDTVPTNSPVNGAKEENDPGGNSVNGPKPLEMIHKQAPGSRQRAPDTPTCTGLIHRTEAGWKHCMERFAASNAFSSGARQDAGDRETGRASVSVPKNDEHDRFYYFDGALRRVSRHVHPRYRRKVSQDNLESSGERMQKPAGLHPTSFAEE